MTQRELGQIRIERLVESIWTDFEPMLFFPDTTPEDGEPHQAWMKPRTLDAASGHIILTLQAFLVRAYHPGAAHEVDSR